MRHNPCPFLNTFYSFCLLGLTDQKAKKEFSINWKLRLILWIWYGEENRMRSSWCYGTVRKSNWILQEDAGGGLQKWPFLFLVFTEFIIVNLHLLILQLHQWMLVWSTGFLLTQLAIRAVWQADMGPLEVCVSVCVCCGIRTQVLYGLILPRTLRVGSWGLWGGKETLCGTRKHTCDPLLARSSTLILCSPSFCSAAR